MSGTEDFFDRIIYKEGKRTSIRITARQEVVVTVPRGLDRKYVDAFVVENSGWIKKHLTRMREKQPVVLQELSFGENERRELLALVDAWLPAFAPYRVQTPTVRFRPMKSRWGSCNKARASITLNTALCAVTPECRTYVVVHELAHLAEANHSAAFYRVLKSVLPKYREYEKQLKHYVLLEESVDI